MNLLAEKSGLKAHRTLVPASARCAKSHLIWGGKASLDQFLMTRIRAIAPKLGQKILLSKRGAMTLSRISLIEAPLGARVVVRYSNNGDAISAKTHARTGTVVNMSNIESDDPGRGPPPKERVDALDILALLNVRQMS
jgi:hypothetical protein